MFDRTKQLVVPDVSCCWTVTGSASMNSLCLEVRACHINCPDKDVSRFVNSDRMPEYHHPFSVWLPLLFYDCSDKDSCSCMVQDRYRIEPGR